jgi:dihydrofolate reductase
MGKVFVSMGMSLDGMIAGPNRGPTNPLGDHGVEIHSWLFAQEAFRKNLKLGPGGETGADNRIVDATIKRAGANIMGKRMFEEGEPSWPEDAPFHCPVFVLTHQKREPWERKGGTTFFFVNDGIESALHQARKASCGRDVRISGGAEVVLQYLNGGLVDELSIALAPVLIGDGLRLFDGVDKERVSLKIAEAFHSPSVTHLRYAVTPKSLSSYV